ncbi:MAG: hypothetical protein Q8927_19740 [Bacteroidota bacterium]|nr:hypothetical protein [Bacteroidota bacterium]MDP4218437.1 hypothetical protein [Bacteroidota bacterium]MDP4247578.1 hypothetical protein [Bacteroidota bacterium]MDP4255520.1 hypothetical protein [Bacteroidota bacterium]MDP4259650.1 hypothetical protein [Bacteroidota bacterium]
MDKLKEYLLGHKAGLDVDSPADGAWEQIESKMSLERRGSASWRIRYAVAASLIVLSGAGLWLVIRKDKAPADTAKQGSGINRAPAPRGDSGKAAVNGVASAPPGQNRDGGPKPAGHKTRHEKPMEPSDAVGMIDKSYASLIDFQLKKLRATPLYAENGSYFSFYVEQFKQMDQDEQAVRNDIKRYGLTNEFLEQLINVYQQKLNVLKNLETEINKMNNKVREKQSPRVQPELHYLDI